MEKPAIWRREYKAYCPRCKKRTMIPIMRTPTVTSSQKLSKEKKKTVYRCEICNLTN